MLTYRKDEIMDLISTCNKVLDQAQADGPASMKKKIPADLDAKRDKM